MTKKISITIDSPICFKRIANGEKIIYQTRPDKIDFEFGEVTADAESRWMQLTQLLNQVERDLRRDKSKKKSKDRRDRKEL